MKKTEDTYERVLVVAFWVVRILMTGLAMVIAAPLLLDMGAMERGCYAFGGEILLIPLVGYAMWRLIGTAKER